MEQSWSSDQFSSYDYYGPTASNMYGINSNSLSGGPLKGRMVPNGPAEMALAAAQRAREQGVSAEVWAPCDANGRCLQYGQPDGPGTLRAEDYERWSDNPPLNYQDRNLGLQARFNALAKSEIQGARQRVVDPRHIEIPSYESLYAPANGPTRPIVSGIIHDGRAEHMTTDAGCHSGLGLEVTNGGVFISFELIIFFLFVMMLAIIMRQKSAINNTSFADITR
jgi:hypothetical protein